MATILNKRRLIIKKDLNETFGGLVIEDEEEHEDDYEVDDTISLRTRRRPRTRARYCHF